MPEPTPLHSQHPSLTLRDALSEDMDAIAAIYAHYVETSAATYEEIAPSTEDMAQRYALIKGKGLPYIVAESNGTVVGYAYAGLYRERSGYRYTVGDSVYVDKDWLNHGAGRALLEDLIARCKALGYRQMIAVIGDSTNAASIALHSQLGFKVIGALEASGRKFNRWVDTVLMQRALGDGSATAPD